MMIIRRKSMNQGVLMRDITISTPFTTRETAGGKILNRSLAEITSITGNTLVLNQLANSSEEVHVAGLTKANITTFDKAKVGDKLYIKVKVKKESVITFVDPGVSTTEEISLRVGDANSGQHVMLIDDVPIDAEYYVVSALVTNGNADNDTLVISSTNIDEIYVKDAVIINLTRMYGSGNEPTLKEFEQAYPLDYYDQTDGRLLDFKGTTLVSKDSSENILDTVSLDVTTLTGKLCEEIFPDGLKRAGNVYDEIKVENGLLYAIKRVGSVNLGSLTIDYVTISDVNFFQCTIPNADMLISTPNITSSRYLSTNVPFGEVSNMYVKPHDTIGNYIYIRNDSYTTAASFKTAMSGVLLYYELATELRYLIDTTDPYIAKYKVDGWGTEEIVLDTNACSPSMTINYPDSSIENTRFTYRKTADGTKLNVNGDAFITNLKGETVAWNQIAQAHNELSFSSDTETWFKVTDLGYNPLVNQKIYLSAEIKKTTDFVAADTQRIALQKHPGSFYGGTIYVSSIATDNTYHKVRVVVSNANAGNNSIALQAVNHTAGNMYVKNVMAINLTTIYGVGNEPTSPAVFEADYLKWFGKPLTYESYDAGSLKPVKMVSMKTVGFNAADYDEMKVGSDNYAYSYGGYYCKSFKLLPNTTYRIRKKASSYGSVVLLINSDSAINSGNYFDTRSSSSYSKDYTTNSSGLLYVGVVSGTSAQVKARLEEIDLQIYLINDDSRNGHYESHWHNKSMLNVTELKGRVVTNGEPTGNLVTIFPDGMKSAGNVCDYIGKENGLWVAYKRIGSVNLGEVNYGYNSSYAAFYKTIDDVITGKNYIPFVISKYSKASGVGQNNLTDKSYGVSTLSGKSYTALYIKDSAYTDITTFKTAMSGVMLYYELATPQKYILDNTMHWLYKIDQQGVEEILPQNTSVPTTSPAKLNIKYKTIKPTQLIKVSQTNTNLRSCRVLYGLPYSIKISPYDGFSLYEDPIIKMGGVDITSTAYDPTYNMITIPSVTGDVDINVDAREFFYITFEDPAVEAICVANWGGNYEAGKISNFEAMRVTTLGNKFENNANIVKFNELQYFTGLTTLTSYREGQYIGGMSYFGAFHHCTNLEEITLPTITMNGSKIGGLFCGCSKLKTVDMSPITITGTAHICNICGTCSTLTSAILPTASVPPTYLGAIYAFQNCTSLLTVDASRVNFANMNFTNNSNIFPGATKLTRIIGGLSGFRNTESGIKFCPLTHDAAVELLESLGTVASARTITLKTSTYNTLTAEEKAIATNKGWTLNYG